MNRASRKHKPRIKGPSTHATITSSLQQPQRSTRPSLTTNQVMRFLSNCAVVLIAMAIVSLVRESDCLTQEERSFLSSELRSWLVEANQGLLQQEYAALPEDQSAFVNLLDRRLRNDAKAQGKSGDKWNNIGMHNLFRLDKRSRL